MSSTRRSASSSLGLEDRAKCVALDGFGRALHGAQDFYSHSNGADEADPTRPVGSDNPPGLNLSGPSPVLELRGAGTIDVPAELATGCYVLKDEVPGVGECAGRVTHAALNQDNGLIDPTTGAATEPTRPRGMVGDNFAKAVSGAIAETQRQWQDFQAELSARYGDDHAALMVCALTPDDRAADCPERGWTGLAVGLLVAAAVVAAGCSSPFPFVATAVGRQTDVPLSTPGPSTVISHPLQIIRATPQSGTLRSGFSDARSGAWWIG